MLRKDFVASQGFKVRHTLGVDVFEDRHSEEPHLSLHDPSKGGYGYAMISPHGDPRFLPYYTRVLKEPQIFYTEQDLVAFYLRNPNVPCPILLRTE